MKKRASVPTTILVIGIFLVCAIALISFIIYPNKTRDSFVGLVIIEKINAQVEDYLFYKDLSRASATEKEGGIVFYQEKKETSGFLLWKKERVVFSVEYMLPK